MLRLPTATSLFFCEAKTPLAKVLAIPPVPIKPHCNFVFTEIQAPRKNPDGHLTLGENLIPPTGRHYKHI
jgi:hypothetical protein